MCSYCFAQNPETSYTYKWLNNSWELQDIRKSKYNKLCKVVSTLYQYPWQGDTVDAAISYYSYYPDSVHLSKFTSLILNDHSRPLIPHKFLTIYTMQTGM